MIGKKYNAVKLLLPKRWNWFVTHRRMEGYSPNFTTILFSLRKVLESPCLIGASRVLPRFVTFARARHLRVSFGLARSFAHIMTSTDAASRLSKAFSSFSRWITGGLLIARFRSHICSHPSSSLGCVVRSVGSRCMNFAQHWQRYTVRYLRWFARPW